MKKHLFTSIRIAAEIIILAALTYYSRQPLLRLVDDVRETYFPCSKPLTYRVDIFDDRFGLRREDLLAAAAVAEQVWEGPAGRQLFVLAEDGDLRLNLIYDYRQEATDKLRQMGLEINDDRSTYDSLRTKYEQSEAGHRRRKAEYETEVKDFESRRDDYEAQVRSWNERGGAPPAEFERLGLEKAALESEVVRLKSLAAGVNESASEVNALVTVLNKLIEKLNLTADTFNRVAQDRGKEFQQGLYRDSTAGNEIDIYEFEDQAQLIRVLAHEFGHAAGLEHMDDLSAIMNMRNAGQNIEPAASDIAALRARCGPK